MGFFDFFKRIFKRSNKNRTSNNKINSSKNSVATKEVSSNKANNVNKTNEELLVAIEKDKADSKKTIKKNYTKSKKVTKEVNKSIKVDNNQEVKETIKVTNNKELEDTSKLNKHSEEDLNLIRSTELEDDIVNYYEDDKDDLFEQSSSDFDYSSLSEEDLELIRSAELEDDEVEDIDIIDDEDDLFEQSSSDFDYSSLSEEKLELIRSAELVDIIDDDEIEDVDRLVDELLKENAKYDEATNGTLVDETKNNNLVNQDDSPNDDLLKIELSDIAYLPIKLLDFSSYIDSKLRNKNVNTIGDLFEYKPEDILKNFLTLTLSEVKTIRTVMSNGLDGIWPNKVVDYVIKHGILSDKTNNEVVGLDETKDVVENNIIEEEINTEEVVQNIEESTESMSSEESTDDLKNTGFSENIINELVKGGVNSIDELLKYTPKEVLDKFINLSFADVTIIRNYVIDNQESSSKDLDNIVEETTICNKLEENKEVLADEPNEKVDNFDLFSDLDDSIELVNEPVNDSNNSIINKEYEDLEVVEAKARQNDTRVKAISNREETELDLEEVDYKYSYLELDLDNIDNILSTLQSKIDSGNLIGYDLLQIISNDKIVKEIHNRAETQLKSYVYQTSYSAYKDNSAILISLIIIAIENYDTKYWDYVYETYVSLMKITSRTKVYSILLEIISYYSGMEKRHINFILKQAIVPKKYLENSIDFAYDIFDKVLDRKYSDDCDKVIAQVYLDMNFKNKDEFIISGKTYKLIDTIKEIISNTTWLAELVAYTKLLIKYINAYYYEEENRDLEYKDYLEPIFVKWQKKNHLLFKNISRERPAEVQYKPSFSLNGVNVYLNIPNTVFNKSVSAQNAYISLLHNLVEVRKADIPDIRETMGVYQAKAFKIKLDNPFDKLSYRMISDGKVIYDSKNLLYRDLIMFNDKNKEVSSIFNYQGDTNFVYPSNTLVEGIKPYHNAKDYSIANKYINKFDSVKIGTNTLVFGNKVSEIIGEVIPDTFISTLSNKYPLYKSVDSLTIVTKYAKEDLILQFNQLNHHFNFEEIDYTMGVYVYRVDLKDLVTEGFNYVKITTNKDELVYKSYIFIDCNYSSKYSREEDYIKLKINSVFVSKNLYEVEVSKFDLDKISFRHHNFEGPLWLEPKFTIPLYSINNVWYYFDESIIYKDILEGTKIYIKGVDFDFMRYFNEKKDSSTLKKFTYKDLVYFSINEISQYKGLDSKFGYVSFYKRGYEQARINIYYKVILDENKVVISYDEEKRKGIAHIEYKGKDDLRLDIYHDDEFFRSIEINESPTNIEVDGLIPFEKYNIKIIGGKKQEDIFSSETEYELFNVYSRIYSTHDLTYHTFELESGVIEKYFDSIKNFREFNVDIKHSYLEFGKMIDKGFYEAKLIVESQGKHELMVDVEILSVVQKSRFNCYVSHDEDGILYNNGTSRLIIDETDEDVKLYNPVIMYVAKYVK